MKRGRGTYAPGGLSAAKRRQIAAAALVTMNPAGASFAKAMGTTRRSANARTGGFLGIEKKFIDYEYDETLSLSLAGAEADPGGSVLAISAVATGTGESNRDGRKIVIKDAFVSGVCELDGITGATLSNGGIVKIALVLDQQTNGAQFNAEDVFVDPSDADLDALTFRNLEHQRRFKVLKQVQLVMNPSAGAGDGAANDQGRYTIPFRLAKQGLNIPVNHGGTTAEIASINDNSLHVLAVGSGALMQSAKLKYVSRVRFVG